MRRKAFLEHVGWTGAGIVWSMSAAGVLEAQPAGAADASFRFVQISDSHIGFHRPENPDVAGTLAKAVAAINALPVQPAFVVHTGDITHLSKPDQFDTAKGVLQTLRAPLIQIPGEHDVIAGPQSYFAAFRNAHAPDGWFSFDQAGIHFVALVNVFDFEKMGLLGSRQLDWVRADLAAQKATTPVVVFAHVPLYALYAPWGWTTQDGAQVLAWLARFERVTVLNGHIHQVIRHREGNIEFATAAATAYPQPAPGSAPQPGPLAVPADHLLKVIGYRSVSVEPSGGAAIDDRPLA